MQKSPERFILAAALVLLALGAGALAFLFPGWGEIAKSVSPSEPKGKTIEKIAPDMGSQIVKAWSTPAQWKAGDNKQDPFVSDRFFFFPDSADPFPDIRPVVGETVIQGINWTYIEKYGLDYRSPTLATDDADNDGIANLMEFKDGTNPKDIASHHDYTDLMRMKRFERKPFRMRFQSYNEEAGGGKTFQIRLNDLPGSPQKTVRKGDQLGGYVVGDFRPHNVHQTNKSTGVEEDLDLAELDLTIPTVNFTTTLVLRQDKDSPESTANMIVLLPGYVDKEIRAPRASEFEIEPLYSKFQIPGVDGKNYEVLAIEGDTVTIRQEGTTEEIKASKSQQFELPDQGDKKFSLPPNFPTKKRFLVLKADESGATVRDLETKKEQLYAPPTDEDYKLMPQGVSPSTAPVPGAPPGAPAP